MSQEPVFNVTNKMFELLSDWQEQIDHGTIEDPVAKADDSPQSNPPENQTENRESSENNPPRAN
jgi:hypothetical protein